MAEQSIHFDPEFKTFTYGDPNTLKARLRTLKLGHLLVFYCGLEGWDFKSDPALYLLAYFEVEVAGRARELGDQVVRQYFEANFHVRHRSVYDHDKESLVLVKGKIGESRKYERAHCISSLGKNRAGKPLKVLSREMYKHFSDFGGKVSIERSAPRWVPQTFVDKAAEYVRMELLQKKKIPGFGHRVYKTMDPRAVHLRTLSEQLGKAMGQEKWCRMSMVVEKTCKELKNLNPNVDFYAASTYYLLGFEMDLFTPIFACSRAPGWIAHVIEQHTDNRLIRPLEEYIGPPERPYVPLDERP